MKRYFVFIIALVFAACHKNLPESKKLAGSGFAVNSGSNARTDNKVKGKHLYWDASANDYVCYNLGGCLGEVVINGGGIAAAYADFENAVAQNTVQEFFSSYANYEPLFGSGYFDDNEVVLEHLTADADVQLVKYTGTSGKAYYLALPAGCSSSLTGQALCDSAVFNFVFDPE